MKGDKQPLSGRSFGLAFLIAALIVGVASLFLLSPTGNQFMRKEESEGGSCDLAAAWHYKQALNATPEAEQHFWAGVAAENLENRGLECPMGA